MEELHDMPGAGGTSTAQCDTNIHAMLDRTAASVPLACAVSDSGRSWSYTELQRKTADTALWLSSVGVRPGDRILVGASYDCRIVALLFAASRLGATFVPVNPTVSPQQLSYILNDAAPKIVVGLNRIAESSLPFFSLDSVDQGASGFASNGGSPRHSGVAPALLIYTSGSTSMPKAVECPHAQVTFASQAIQKRLQYKCDDVVFCRIPLFFDYGLYQIFLCTLSGAHLTLADSGVDGRLIAEIRSRKSTILPLVPGLAVALTKLAARDNAPTRLRLITNTGEELASRTIDDLCAAFPHAAIQLMYGITECKRVTIMEPDGHITRPNSVGMPLEGTWIRIVDDQGLPARAGQNGLIVVGGPHVMAGYWRAPELTNQIFGADENSGERVLFTGDYGHVDEAGYLYFAGRRDDIFKVNGVRTSGHEVAAAVRAVPGVREAVVLPPILEAEAVICVTGNVREVDVLRGARKLIDRLKIPYSCRVFEELPRMANGKIDKKKLREWVS